ncbi:MAG TPA: type 4a pilus biogenesis protein PilO [Thermoanaerobaculia bacterium]|nr:type 4a pilus biogenesis protein PilO [Thermoanaerobaculia bacterium]
MAVTLDDKPRWMGLLVGLILAGGAVFAADYLVVKDIKKEIAEAEKKIGELEEKIQKGRAAERKLPQFREEVKRLELELEKLRRILPSARNTEEIIKKIKSLVDEGEFSWRRLSFPPLNRSSKEAYTEWPIAVAVDGRFHDLAILFNKLGNFSRIMNVENIRISALPNQENRTIAADFTAKTFIYIEPPKEDQSKKPGGKGKGKGKGKK